MNEIVKPHYPVSRLPEDLRRELGPATHVTLRIAAEAPGRRPTLDELRRRVAAQPGFRPYDTAAEAVEVVRWVRDAEGAPPPRWSRR